MNRRSFLGAILAAAAAPAIVRADSLMRILPRETTVLAGEGVQFYESSLDLNFASEDLALTIDEFSRRYIEPAVAALVSRVEADMMRGVRHHRIGNFTELLGRA